MNCLSSLGPTFPVKGGGFGLVALSLNWTLNLPTDTLNHYKHQNIFPLKDITAGKERSYKMHLFNSKIKKGKGGEKAFIHLKSFESIPSSSPISLPPQILVRFPFPSTATILKKKERERRKKQKLHTMFFYWTLNFWFMKKYWNILNFQL